jgi:drug/metabolite transporter (DMT)-like permease
MTAVLLALSASLCYGVGDFMGGLAARRVAVLHVVVMSQLVGALLVATLAALSGQQFHAGPSLLAGAGGILGGLALIMFYRGMAIGMMSVVAPISACGALVPVIVALARGDVPPPLTLGGMALAFAGVILVSLAPGHSPVRAGTVRRDSVMLAIGAAAGFGLFLVFLARASHLAPHSVLWLVLGGRIGSLSMLLTIAVASSRHLRLGIIPRRYLVLVVGAGSMDTGANVFLALATTRGNLGVVGVLASLYPAVTVLLAGGLLHERLRALQAAGVAGALAGVVLVAAG